MDKAILPKDVVEAIEEIRKSGMTDFFIIGEAYRGESKHSNMIKIIQYIRDHTGDWDCESEKGYTHVMKYLVNTQRD